MTVQYAAMSDELFGRLGSEYEWQMGLIKGTACGAPAYLFPLKVAVIRPVLATNSLSCCSITETVGFFWLTDMLTLVENTG